MSDQITKDMTFHQVMQQFPKATAVFGKYHLGCVGCMGAANETLEMGAGAHGIDINDLLRDLNAAIAE